MPRIGQLSRRDVRNAARRHKGNHHKMAVDLGVSRTTVTQALQTYLIGLAPFVEQLRVARDAGKAVRRHFTPEELAVIERLGYRKAVEELQLGISKTQLQRWVVRQRAEEREAAPARSHKTIRRKPKK